MPTVWKSSRPYSLLRKFVNFNVALSYRRIAIEGRENIPEGGVVLLAPNHCNTLMDALVVLRANRNTTAFGARADVFKKTKVANILYFLRILPVPRMRDGASEVLGNHQLVEQTTEVLDHDVDFCLFVEGTHRTKHSLQPIKKGIFRMALSAVEKLNKPVYILPVGLEYGDYFNFRSTSLLTYGRPICVNDVIAEHPGASENEIYHILAPMLKERMEELISYLPDDEHYEEHWAKVQAAKKSWYPTLKEELNDTQRIISDVQAGKEVPARKHPVFHRVLMGIMALILLPVFLFEAVASCPMWITSLILGSKVKDKAFLNTVRFGVRFVLYPLMFIIWALVAFLNLKWYWALLAFALCLPSYSFFYDYINFTRKLFDIK